MTTRWSYPKFNVANRIYRGATVTFYTVSAGVKTSTELTLYAASSGATTLTNPITLDSDGKLPASVFVEANTITTVSGLTIADHDTGIFYANNAGTDEVIHATHAKVGTTSGFVVDAADNLGYLATLPASKTGSTCVCRLTGLKVNQTISAFKVVGQIESAGGTVTIDAELRKHTAVAGDVTDESVGSITQVSVTADSKVEAEKTGLSEVVAGDETFYVLITATTGSSCDIVIMSVTVTAA